MPTILDDLRPLPVAFGWAALGAFIAGLFILLVIFRAGHSWWTSRFSARHLARTLFLLGSLFVIVALALVLFVGVVTPIVWASVLLACSLWMFALAHVFPPIESTDYSPKVMKIPGGVLLGLNFVCLLASALSPNTLADILSGLRTPAPLNLASVVNGTTQSAQCFNFTELSTSIGYSNCVDQTDATFLRALRPGIRGTPRDALFLVRNIWNQLDLLLPLLMIKIGRNYSDFAGGCRASLFQAMCEYYFPVCNNGCDPMELPCAETCTPRAIACSRAAEIFAAIGPYGAAQDILGQFLTSEQKDVFVDYLFRVPLCSNPCYYASLEQNTPIKAACRSPNFYDNSSGSCSLVARNAYAEEVASNMARTAEAEQTKYLLPPTTIAFTSLWLIAAFIYSLFIWKAARYDAKEFDICQRTPEILASSSRRSVPLISAVVVALCFSVSVAIGTTLLLLAYQIEYTFLLANESGFELVTVVLAVAGCVCLGRAMFDIFNWRSAPEKKKKENDPEKTDEQHLQANSATPPLLEQMNKLRKSCGLTGALFRYRFILMELIEIVTQLVAVRTMLTNVPVGMGVFVIVIISLNIASFGLVQLSFQPVYAVALDVIFDGLYFATTLYLQTLVESPNFFVAVALAFPAMFMSQTAHGVSLELRTAFSDEVVPKRQAAKAAMPVFISSWKERLWRREWILVLISVICGSVLLGTTISKRDAMFAMCRNQVGDEVWSQISPKKLFMSQGFYGEWDCGFAAVNQLVLTGVSSLSSTQVSSLFALETLHFSDSNIRHVPGALLESPRIKIIGFPPTASIVMNITREIIPTNLMFVAPYLQHLNVSFTSNAVVQSVLSGMIVNVGITFPKLDTLDISNSQVTDLPPFWGRINSTKFVDVSNNQIQNMTQGFLSRWFGISPNDKTLLAIGNPLSHIELPTLEAIPTVFFQQFVSPNSPLKQLIMAFGKFLTLDEVIFDLPNLEELRITFGIMANLSPSISKLRKIKILDVQVNFLTSLPPTLSTMASLTTFVADLNNFTSYPPALANLTQLQYLGLRLVDVSENNNSFLPANVSTFIAPETVQIGRWNVTSPFSGTVKKLSCDPCFGAGSFPPTLNVSNLEIIAISQWFNLDLSNCVNLQVARVDGENGTTTITNPLNKLQFAEFAMSPASLPNLPALQTIRFFEDSANGSLPSDFWGAQSTLRAMSLATNSLNLSDFSVKNLTKLQLLHVGRYTYLSPSQINELFNLPSMSILDIRGVTPLDITNFAPNFSAPLCLVLLSNLTAPPENRLGNLTCQLNNCDTQTGECSVDPEDLDTWVCFSCSKACFGILQAGADAEAFFVDVDIVGFSSTALFQVRYANFGQYCGLSTC